jgi:2-polyprenyl-3-methyl-5-hydroxy-6-metoxy-1,4-benzoquinol methylase
MAEEQADGGYDWGYFASSCFWGTKPGSMVRHLKSFFSTMTGLRVLDMGCGEGGNAVFLSAQGAFVDAYDISTKALANGRTHWGQTRGVTWHHADITKIALEPLSYDVVVAYGLLHCLNGADSIGKVITTMKEATRIGGYNILCAFNDRFQDFEGHCETGYTVLPHNYYCQHYGTWQVVHCTDEDLVETHPPKDKLHRHAMTRLMARKLG